MLLGYIKKKLQTAVAVAAMLTVAGTVSAVSAESIQMGDSGVYVAELQGRLADSGYAVEADGEFGPATREAVKEFQRDHGLVADGMVGPATYSQLMGKAMPEVSRSSNFVSRRIISTAMSYLGTPYVFGGNSPAGFDCSGFVQYVFASSGISLPRMADGQYEVGMPINKSELRPGDMVFFSTYEPGPSHVGIYVGDGNFIHASSSGCVKITSLYKDYYVATYIGARRIAD